MKENKDANNSNTNNTTNNKNTNPKRNSDIIKEKKETNIMNNIDLNKITLDEAKAAGVTGADLITVLRNPVMAEAEKAKAEVAKKVEETSTSKKNSKYNFSASAATMLGWKKVEDGFDISNAARLFEGLVVLFGNKDFTTWIDRKDYKDALLLVASEIFGNKVSDEDLIKRAHLNVLNLNWGITYIKEKNESVLRGSLYNAYLNPFNAAAEIGLISEEECNRYNEYMLKIK